MNMTLANVLLRCCVVRGSFTLHSGGATTWRFDALRAYSLFPTVLAALEIPPYLLPVGIETGGMLLASEARCYGIVRKDGTTYLPNDLREIALIDDVVTTGASVEQAAKACEAAGRVVAEVYCILNRGDYPCKSLIQLSDCPEGPWDDANDL